jgi:excisionase family DNA binding protein
MEDLTVTQAAEELGISERWARELVSRGSLRGYRHGHGGRWFITRQEVERFQGKPQSLPKMQAYHAIATPEPPSLAMDLAMQTHIREIEFFGQRLRDNLFIPHAGEIFPGHERLIISRNDILEMLPWRRETRTNGQAYFYAEERAVARRWGEQVRDQRRNPDFPLLRAHLKGHPCWTTLERIQEAFAEYYYRSEEIHILVGTLIHHYGPEYEPEMDDRIRSKYEFQILDSILRHLLWMPELYPRYTKKHPFRFKGGIYSEFWACPALCGEPLLDIYPTYWWMDPSTTSLRHPEMPRMYRSLPLNWWYDITRKLPPLVTRVTGPLFRRIRRRTILPSLIGWILAVTSFSQLIVDWRNELGTDPYLRASIVQGRCPACPR